MTNDDAAQIPQMTQFQDDLDRYGPEVDSWPAPARASAQALLSGHVEARRRLAAARRLEAGLSAVFAAPAADARLLARIAAEVPQHPQPATAEVVPLRRTTEPGARSRRGVSPGYWAASAAAMLLAAAIGFKVAPTGTAVTASDSASLEGEALYLSTDSVEDALWN